MAGPYLCDLYAAFQHLGAADTIWTEMLILGGFCVHEKPPFSLEKANIVEI